MIFEQNNSIENIGKKVGYLFSYFLFTTLLFFVILLSKKLPNTWTYFHIMVVTAGITLIGVILKNVLK